MAFQSYRLTLRNNDLDLAVGEVTLTLDDEGIGVLDFHGHVPNTIEALLLSGPDAVYYLTCHGSPNESENPAVGIGFAGRGSLCLDLDSTTLYINTADEHAPFWEVVYQQA